jgi:hypothetical protein
MATSFSGGRSRSTQRKPPTMDKQLVNLITCGYESSAPFCNLQSRARTHAVLVTGLYELLGNPTTSISGLNCFFIFYFDKKMLPLQKNRISIEVYSLML